MVNLLNMKTPYCTCVLAFKSYQNPKVIWGEEILSLWISTILVLKGLIKKPIDCCCCQFGNAISDVISVRYSSNILAQ